MTYPDKIIRGIPNKNNFIDEDGYPSSNLFYFEVRAEIPPREDDCYEESINWYDDESALHIILQQEKEPGIKQFKAGAAILIRAEVDRVRNNQIIKGLLAYERKEIEGNKFHGNLLLKRSVPKSVMKKIAANIALCVSEVIDENIIKEKK